MKNIEIIEKINKAANDYRLTDDKLYETFRETYYDTHFAEWANSNYHLYVGLLFKLITGEDDFDSFYERFGSPGLDKGLKPVAWGPRFLPDEINDLLISTKIDTKEKVRSVKELYKKCVKLERDFKRKSKNKSKRNAA